MKCKTARPAAADEMWSWQRRPSMVGPGRTRAAAAEPTRASPKQKRRSSRESESAVAVVVAFAVAVAVVAAARSRCHGRSRSRGCCRSQSGSILPTYGINRSSNATGQQLGNPKLNSTTLCQKEGLWPHAAWLPHRSLSEVCVCLMQSLEPSAHSIYSR